MSFLTPPEEQTTGFMTENSAWPRANSQPANYYSSGDNSVPSADQSYEAFFNEFVNCSRSPTVASLRPEEDYDILFSGSGSIPETPERFGNNSSGVETATKTAEERYRPAFEIMRKYIICNGHESDIAQCSLAVQASYKVLRQDIHLFAKTYIYSWLSGSLWMLGDDTAGQSLNPSQRRSIDVRQLNTVKGTEANFMIRRLLRMRLYYWYNKLQNELDGQLKLQRGETIKSKAIDTILRESYDDWDRMSAPMKKSHRDSFHRDKVIGKKWWSLVQYFSGGITVLCAKKMDSIMCVLVTCTTDLIGILT